MCDGLLPHQAHSLMGKTEIKQANVIKANAVNGEVSTSINGRFQRELVLVCVLETTF